MGWVLTLTNASQSISGIKSYLERKARTDKLIVDIDQDANVGDGPIYTSWAHGN
jgi:hypothetical protein